jgi:hypothetical protein
VVDDDDVRRHPARSTSGRGTVGELDDPHNECTEFAIGADHTDVRLAGSRALERGELVGEQRCRHEVPRADREAAARHVLGHIEEDEERRARGAESIPVSTSE